MAKYDIIIMAGQSNAEGCGWGAVENAYIPTEKIMQLDIEKTVDHAPEGVIVTFFGEPILSVAQESEYNGNKIGNIVLPFARKYVESGLLAEDRKVLVIRCGIGGTGFKKNHWGLQDSLYLHTIKMVEHALSLHEENRLVACLWHQGEHDAFEKNDPNVYEAQLRALIADLRTRFNVPNLPFITADFVADWKGKNLEACLPITDKIKLVAETVGNAAFVETADLLSNDQANGNGDDIHFCRSAVYELGERFFKRFQEIKGL